MSAQLNGNSKHGLGSMIVCIGRAALSVLASLLVSLVLAAGSSSATEPADRPQPAAPDPRSSDKAFEGSVHALLEVDTDQAVKQENENVVDRVRMALRKARIHYQNLGIADDRVQVTIRDPARIDEAKELLAGTTPAIRSAPTMPNRIFVRYDDASLSLIREATIKRALLTTRVNLEEILHGRPLRLQRVGETNRFVIQFPKGFDPNTVHRLSRHLRRFPQVQFHFLRETIPSDQAQTYRSHPDTQLLPPGPRSSLTGERHYYIVRQRMLFSSNDVLDARVMFAEDGIPEVHLALGYGRTWKFLKETGRRVAIVFDQKVLATPVIRGPILGNTLVIGGELSLEDAQFLEAIILRGGTTSRLNILREWTAPAGFHADTISSGWKS